MPRNYVLLSILVSSLALTGCAQVLGTGVDEEEVQMQHEAEAKVAEQQDAIIELQSEVIVLKEYNKNLAREVYNIRETLANIEKQSKEAVELAQNADRRAMRSGGDFAVHLASYKNVNTTIAGWKSYGERYAEEFKSLVGMYSIFTSGSGEDFYRLKAGPFVSQEAARAFCKTLEARDEYCNIDSFEGEIIE